MQKPSQTPGQRAADAVIRWQGAAAFIRDGQPDPEAVRRIGGIIDRETAAEQIQASFNEAITHATIKQLREQLAAERAENERLKRAASRRENQLVRFYTRKLRLIRWLYRLARKA